MNVEVVTNDIEPGQWNELLDQSPHGTPYHRTEFLDLMAEYSASRLLKMVGYAGAEPIGLFPLFERSFGPISVIFSPPPNLKISYLGPLLINCEKLKRRKADRRHYRFIATCLDVLESEIGPRYQFVRTGFRYSDPRPFLWNSFTATPRYTYLVELSPNKEDLFMQFSADLRKNVRNAEDINHDIYEGGKSDIDWIINQVKNRHHEQGLSYRLSTDFVTALHSSLPKGVIRPYVCTENGRRVSGHIVLETDTTIFSWQSIGLTDTELATSDVLHWRLIRDGIDRGKRYYDLVGANNKRLSGYKSKFSPKLKGYHSIEGGNRMMLTIADVYKRFQ